MRINSGSKFVVFTISWIVFVVVGTTLILQVFSTVKTFSVWQVKKVQVEGLKRISEEEILKILNLPSQVSVWDINLSSLENKLSNHPWIEKAVVKWRFPGVIWVTLVERYPVAILCCDNCFYVDANGRLFSRLERKNLSNSDVPWFTFCPTDLDLSFRVPEGVLRGFSVLMRALRNTFGSLREDVEVSYSTQDGFIVKIQGIKVFVGTENIDEAIARLHYIMQGLKTLGKIEFIQEIDIRYPRWAFVK